jgi:ABC-type transporter Mla MlaB component
VTISQYAVYDDGVLRVTRSGSPPVVALAGEIDESTYPGLVAALAAAVDGQSEVHFDFARVAYCDLAGLRAIVCVTGADHDGNGSRKRVVLHRLSPELETVLRIVGWDCTPGLALNEPKQGDTAPRPGPATWAVIKGEGRS